MASAQLMGKNQNHVAFSGKPNKQKRGHFLLQRDETGVIFSQKEQRFSDDTSVVIDSIKLLPRKHVTGATTEHLYHLKYNYRSKIA